MTNIIDIRGLVKLFSNASQSASQSASQYHINILFLDSSALSRRLELLTENADKIDVSVCVYPYESTDKATSELINDFGLKHIKYPSGNLNVFCQKFDAYYGSACPLVPVFAELKKPVMIADLEI